MRTNKNHNKRTVFKNCYHPYQQKPTSHMKTKTPSAIEKRISAILKENTGTHFLDSGGTNGRAWQRNQKIKSFKSQPVVRVEIWNDEIQYFSVSVFHYLTRFLDITKESERLNKLLQKALKKSDDELQVMEEFAKQMDAGESDYCINLEACNTYNYDCLLSQNLQYCIFHLHGKEYITLQVHNGADARGGYTTPQVFEVNEVDSFTMAQHDIYASDDDNRWTSDNCGYNFSNDEGNDEFKDVVQVKGEKVFNKNTGKEISFCASF